MNNLELLKTCHIVTLRHSNEGRCVISPIYGTYSFSVNMYYKRKRNPFYSLAIGYACEALKYVNALGYK